MSFNIAIAGKGGVGKTSLTGMLIEYLVEAGLGPILAVDADANANLNEVLGEEVDISIGQIKEEINKAEVDGVPLPTGVTKADFMQLRLNQAVAESNGYDLLVMGRGQGAGCYCYVNGILKTQLDVLAKNYEYLIVDNEAGMEHLSRGTLGKIDMLILVSDCSRRGIQAVGRIRDLVEELKLKVPTVKLIVNRAPGGVLNAGTAEEIEKEKLDLIGVVPMDQNVFEYDSYGKPLVDLPADSPAKAALREIVDKLEIIKNKK
ncbi:AAA family ATPase [Acetobacterium fimetarium]|uniref:AAA family ATPase n=1 Tax=Acetobacterium fimetarium TaxID=52691 RepID=A0ABR6WSU9_9FIRM|nr:AAA family ATPase [Acetobacterium fimetarium]MBC3803458.1 AAA family ATPase [Acetobacterium fimetarium]